MQTGNTDYIYKNDLDKACFQHDTQSDKVLRHKAFKIASSLEYDGYQRELASMVYTFFDKKSKGSVVATLANKSAIKSMPNQQLANGLHKPIITKF